MNVYLFLGAQERGCLWWQKTGLPVSPPDIKRWIYWLWLGKLRGSCPLHEQRAVNENGVICSEARKTSSFKRSPRNLGKQSFKAESCYGNLAFQTSVIKMLSVPSVVPTLNHTFQIAWPPLEGVFSKADCAECMNRYDGFTRWHQTRVLCDYVETIRGIIGRWPWGHPLSKYQANGGLLLLCVKAIFQHWTRLSCDDTISHYKKKNQANGEVFGSSSLVLESNNSS